MEHKVLAYRHSQEVDGKRTQKEEGLLIGMEPNFYRPEWKDAIVGPAVFFSSGADGSSESLSREQVKTITDYLNANSVKNYGEFYANVKTDFAFYKPKTVPEM